MIIKDLNNTVRFLTPYVYDLSNRKSMLAIHALDMVSIGIKIGLPFFALEYLIEDDLITGECLLLVAVILPPILMRVKERVLAPVNTRIQRQLTEDLHEQTFIQPYDQHVNTASGDFVQAITSNYGTVSGFVSKFYGDLSPAAVEATALSIVLGIQFGPPALITPAAFVIYILGMSFLVIRYNEARQANMKNVAQNYGGLLASIQRHKMAKQFDRQSLEKEMVKKVMDSSESGHRTEEIIKANTKSWGTLVGYTQFLASVLYTLKLQSDGDLDIYHVYLFNYFSFTVITLIDLVSNKIIDTSTACVDAQKIIEFKTRASTVADVNDASDLSISQAPSIQFNNVHFSYPKQESNQPQKEVLKGISFSINPGETVAFVGKTGVGKSTIAQLIQRFFAPTYGEILINDCAIQNITAKSLYHNLAVVEQATDFLPGTWYENIAYARENATDLQIITAARLAGLIEDTEDASVLKSQNAGASGFALSGGQKQRISVARAILKGGIILVLDEATSALDPKTEQQVQETLNKLSIQVTTVVITHNLCSLSNTDKIFYLQDGLITEQGTCHELIGKQGYFYEQLATQLRERGITALPEMWIQGLSQAPTSCSQKPLLWSNWRPYPSLTFQSSSTQAQRGKSYEPPSVSFEDSNQNPIVLNSLVQNKK